jgi:adenosylcobyric acid synthase
MHARAVMFQGTGSDVGKSLLVAGLCRLLRQQGLRVMPFKAQNMSNNAAVTPCGGEIGRAQWLQAFAAGVEPSIHMNPVLLKPQPHSQSQVVVHGRAVGVMSARDYQPYKAQLLRQVLHSYNLLAQQADIVLVEGAGSASEINLRHNDIANMGFARAAGCPVVLIGDIDRGGVIASVVGTHTVLPPADRALIKAFVINKFRGDKSLFADAEAYIRTHTQWQSLGVVPYYAALSQLPAEDSLALAHKPRTTTGNALHIAVLVTPHMANFDDLDPLSNDPAVRVSWLRAGEVLPSDVDLLIIAGSKATLADLAFIYAQGWHIDIQAHVRRGGAVLGICGGYQMLGRTITDPYGTEGTQGTAQGLALLAVDTIFSAHKTVAPWQGHYNNVPVQGYEIHMGQTTGDDTARPLFYHHAGQAEGARHATQPIMGTYVHGMFSNDAFRRQFLTALGAQASGYAHESHINTILDAWAQQLAQHMNIAALLGL